MLAVEWAIISLRLGMFFGVLGLSRGRGVGLAWFESNVKISRVALYPVGEVAVKRGGEGGGGDDGDRGEGEALDPSSNISTARGEPWPSIVSLETPFC